MQRLLGAMVLALAFWAGMRLAPHVTVNEAAAQAMSAHPAVAACGFGVTQTDLVNALRCMDRKLTMILERLPAATSPAAPGE